MAVENKYVNANIVAGTRGEAPFVAGASTITFVESFEVAAADDNSSIYRIFKGVPADLIPVDIKGFNDAITGGTSFDLGIYLTDLGDVKDADALAATIDMSSARALGSGVSLISAIPVENAKKKIYELAGDTADTRKASYDIAFTANTVGTAAGTITVQATFIVA